MVIAVLEPWEQRRDATTIMNEIRGKLSDLPGVRAFPVMRQAFGGGTEKPVQFVIGGGTYDQLAKWRDTLIEKAKESDLGVTGLDSNYKQTRPQIDINVDYLRAADLGVNVRDIGRTLEVMMGGRQITTYLEDGEEYDVIVEGERNNQQSFTDLRNVYASSQATNELIPMSNLVEIEEYAAAPTLPRFNRVRAITIEANLTDGTTLGEALNGLRELTREHLPEEVIIDYRGQSRDFIYSSGSVIFVFLLGIAVVFLVLAAQFESFIHPLVIMLTVPLALAGGLLGLYLTGATLNIYSQIGLIMLVGLAAKNGILIVEFANQRRDQGLRFSRALIEAARVRMRPIVMTGLTTAAGAIPLVLASGAGSETRIVVGIVIMAGVLAATLFTLFVVPVAYSLLARRTGSPGDTAKRLNREADST
jgi:multidrug efflux pump